MRKCEKKNAALKRMKLILYLHIYLTLIGFVQTKDAMQLLASVFKIM